MPLDRSRLRKPDELATLYATKSVREVYVESRPDRDFFRWYLREAGIIGVDVFAIGDRVFVESSDVFAAGGETGPRGWLLGLAKVASEWKPGQRQKITCIIDSDRYCLGLKKEFEGPHLLRTDFGAIEGYYLQPRPLQQYLDLAISQEIDAEVLIKELTPALNEVFLLRAALHEEEIAMYGHPIAEYDFPKDGEPSVDIAEIVRKSVDAHIATRGRGKYGDLVKLRSSLVARAKTLKVKLPEGRVAAVRGHDIAPILIKKLGLVNQHAIPENVEQNLRLSVNFSDMTDLPLFKALESRLK
jgi:hypothetical protein